MVIDANFSYVFYSYLSEEKNQDTPDKNSNTMNPCQKLIGEFIIESNESNVWDKTVGCEKQYICPLTVYLMTILTLTFNISTSR